MANTLMVRNSERKETISKAIPWGQLLVVATVGRRRRHWRRTTSWRRRRRVRRPGVSADSTSDEDGAARRHQRRDTLLRARREETARDGARTMEGAELWRAFDFGADAKSPIGCAPVGRKYAAEKGGGILGERACLVEKFRYSF